MMGDIAYVGRDLTAVMLLGIAMFVGFLVATAWAVVAAFRRRKS